MENNNGTLSETEREISNEDTASLSGQTVLLNVPNLTTLLTDLGAPALKVLNIYYRIIRLTLRISADYDRF